MRSPWCAGACRLTVPCSKRIRRRTGFQRQGPTCSYFPPAGTGKEAGALKYISQGEAISIDKGYKTDIRNDWLMISLFNVSNTLFIMGNNLYPRLIINEARAHNH